jgi:hypothetical protein
MKKERQSKIKKETIKIHHILRKGKLENIVTTDKIKEDNGRRCWTVRQSGTAESQ